MTFDLTDYDGAPAPGRPGVLLRRARARQRRPADRREEAIWARARQLGGGALTEEAAAAVLDLAESDPSLAGLLAALRG